MVPIAKKLTKHMDPIMALFLIGILFSAVKDIITTSSDREFQSQEAEKADKRQLENQKALMDYESELQQSTNTIATQKGHAADAGVNPALLFGGLPSLMDVSSGSGQGTLPNLPNLSQVSNKLTPSSLAETMLTSRSVAVQERNADAAELSSKGQFMRDMSQAMENMRNTKFQKSMERVIYDKSMAELDLMRSQKAGYDISNIRAQLLLPGELKQQGLISEEISARIRETDERIKNYPVERAKLRSDMQYIQSSIQRNNKLNEVSDMDLKETQERYNGTVVQRIMSEYGLSARQFRGPGNLVDKTNMLLGDKRYLGAVAQLVSLGFSQEEAVSTTLYYVANDPKDVTPSAVNAVSRGLSALILKK